MTGDRPLFVVIGVAVLLIVAGAITWLMAGDRLLSQGHTETQERQAGHRWAFVRTILRLALWAGAWIGLGIVAAYLLSPTGQVRAYLELDIHRLLQPLFIVIGGAVALIVARAVTPTPWKEYLALGLVGGTQTAMAYTTLAILPDVLQDIAQEGRYVTLAATLEDGAARLAHLAVPSAGLMALLTLYRSFDFWAAQSGRQWLSPALGAVVALVWGIGLSLMLRSLGPLWAPLPTVGLAALGTALVLTAAFLLSYLKNSSVPLLAGLGGWASTSAFQASLLGAFLSFYITLVRPALYEHLRYAAVLEWLGVGLVLVALYRVVETFLNRTYAEAEEEELWLQWVNHQQVIVVIPDPNLKYAEAVQRQFLEDGLREPLLVYVTSVLAWNETPQQVIARVIRPLVQHQDDHSGWLPSLFPWQRKREEQRNRQTRNTILAELVIAVREQAMLVGIRQPVLASASQDLEERSGTRAS